MTDRDERPTRRGDGARSDHGDRHERNDASSSRSSGTRSLSSVVASARRDLESLLGQPVERVSSVVRDDGGWRLNIDVVELARVPDSTSVLGSYEVRLDGNGDVIEYERTRRFYRNRADEEGV